MVENTISQLTPIVKNTDDIRFLSIGTLPAVLSTEVARHFSKRHDNIIQEIDRLRSILPKSFVDLNFQVEFRIVPTGNGGTRKVRQCALTRDALSLHGLHRQGGHHVEAALYRSLQRHGAGPV